MTRRPNDGDPFNDGWNAALDEAEKLVKALPYAGKDEEFILVAKADVLAIIRGDTLDD